LNGKIKIAAIAVIMILAISTASIIAICCLDRTDSNSSDDQEGTSATVWLDDGVSEIKYDGVGDTVKQIISSALSDDYNIVFSGNGNIVSVDGIANTDVKVWTIFKWASPSGWSVFVDKSSNYIDGMTLTLSYADKTSTDGTVTYSIPDIDVEYKVYFFIQMKEQYNSTEWMQNMNLDDATKQEGVWIEGTGSTSNEALADAVISYFYPGSEYTVTESSDTISYMIDGKVLFSYGTKSGSYGWFLSFLGWSDTKQSSEGGDYGTWTYWSQYTYHPDAASLDDPEQWGYNQTSFGMYDITEYHYFGLILQTTTAEDDVDADIPVPSEIPDGL
jgi:hypothetical protein